MQPCAPGIWRVFYGAFFAKIRRPAAHNKGPEGRRLIQRKILRRKAGQFGRAARDAQQRVVIKLFAVVIGRNDPPSFAQDHPRVGRAPPKRAILAGGRYRGAKHRLAKHRRAPFPFWQAVLLYRSGGPHLRPPGAALQALLYYKKGGLVQPALLP